MPKLKRLTKDRAGATTPNRKAAQGSRARGAPKSRRGRPTAARVEAIHRAILVAATDEFMTVGFEAASMEAIASNARVSKGTLYARYPNKEALVSAAIKDQIAIWSEKTPRDEGNLPQDPKQRLKHRAHLLMEFYASGDIGFTNMIIDSKRASRQLRDIQFNIHEGAIKVLAQDMLGGDASDQTSAQAALRAAEMLMCTLAGWWRTHTRFRRVTLEEAFEYADHVVDVLFAARAAW